MSQANAATSNQSKAQSKSHDKASLSYSKEQVKYDGVFQDPLLATGFKPIFGVVKEINERGFGFIHVPVPVKKSFEASAHGWAIHGHPFFLMGNRCQPGLTTEANVHQAPIVRENKINLHYPFPHRRDRAEDQEFNQFCLPAGWKFSWPFYAPENSQTDTVFVGPLEEQPSKHQVVQSEVSEGSGVIFCPASFYKQSKRTGKEYRATNAGLWMTWNDFKAAVKQLFNSPRFRLSPRLVSTGKPVCDNQTKKFVEQNLTIDLPPAIESNYIQLLNAIHFNETMVSVLRKMQREKAANEGMSGELQHKLNFLFQLKCYGGKWEEIAEIDSPIERGFDFASGLEH